MKSYHRMNRVITITLLAVSLISFLSSGCATTTAIPEGTRDRLTRQVVGQRFWLKTSQFGGQFYDDRRFKLLDPKPFEQITALTTSDGHLITPPAAEGIISAGTQVRVKSVEWPTGSVVFKRPLYSPRYETWIKLGVALDRGAVTLERPETYIMLVPNNLSNEADFMRWFNSTFSKNDVNDWILSLDKHIRNAILSKTVTKGMDQEQLFAALGHPDQLMRKRVDKNDQTITREIATYGGKIILLEAGKVIEIHAAHTNKK